MLAKMPDQLLPSSSSSLPTSVPTNGNSGLLGASSVHRGCPATELNCCPCWRGYAGHLRAQECASIPAVLTVSKQRAWLEHATNDAGALMMTHSDPMTHDPFDCTNCCDPHTGTLKPGQILNGKYTIQEVLGSGSNATTYKVGVFDSASRSRPIYI